MSTFLSYDRVGADYDATRRAIGSEIILDCLAALAPPVGELALLDAGCGTGAYSQALAGEVGHITAIDLSEGMLAAARAKLADEAAAGRLAFCRGSITDLPFVRESFDAVMTNQVLHHLDDPEDESYPRLRRAIEEFARVLRPGGGLIMNTCAREQLRGAYWYWRLAPVAGERYSRRFAPLETLHAILTEAGLQPRGTFVPRAALCQGEAYFDGRGPLDPVWRNGDSFWGSLSEDELRAASERVRALDAEGRLADFVAEGDRERPRLGQITVVFARRPGG